MRTLLIVLSLALLSLTVVACTNVTVRSDYDPSVDFDSFRTYAWISPSTESPPETVTLLAQRVQQATDQILASRGMQRVAEGQADVLIAQHFVSTPKLQINTAPYGYTYGPWARDGFYPSNTDVTQYEEGTLAIDFIDPATRHMLWRGTAQSRVRNTGTPEQRDERIRSSVEKILAAYPPASSGG